MRTSAIIALLAITAACGGTTTPAEEKDFGLDESALTSDNGLSTNGLSTNGLSTNGLSTNGLSTNGLAAGSFSTWFNPNPSFGSMVMKYIVRCAVPAGQSRSYTFNGVTYTWQGNLGLAPNWAAGYPATLAEQELVSACMAAHTNRYGQQVSISVRGYYADGSPITIGSSEYTYYPNDEGCFFGNLFNGAGVFSAYSSASPLTNPVWSSLRACAANSGYVGSCANMTATGYSVQQICGGYLSDINNYFMWTDCSYGGVSYRPICVELQAAVFNKCGDGICQQSESCSTCAADCGVCH